ncbi:papain-like proteinase [carnivorous sponge associated iridovirus]|nr:papain-like proteinase [carnivorous sponge associated iridovirus]
MENYISRKPMNLEGFDEEDKLTQYLENQGAIVLQEETGGLSTVAAGHLSAATELEQFSEDIIIPPLNTDIRFSEHLPFHDHTKYEKKEHSHAHTDPKIESFNDVNQEGKYLIIPPLNTDIRFSKELPTLDLGSYDPRQHKHSGKEHPHKLHTHEHVHENFSWAIPTNHDSPLDLVKKSLIHEVSTQHACGSCYAVAFADTLSDCLVVSGAVGWSPNISATYLMSCIPMGKLHKGCFGGNPAAIAPYLENEPVADTSCIDYSWCSGDKELCKSVSSARHFDAKTLASKLNDNMPKPCGCYYKGEKKYLYKIDTGSDVFFINNEVPIDVFRNTIKSHILDFGPVIGGYVVLKNFFTGNFTDPHFNGGVYLDRADYNGYKGGKLKFSDSMTSEAAGLHAISIVGWGVAKNIQYDNDKVGDVPYWHCRNSWGKKWGNAGGYFKMAMYPFNKIAQFDKQVMTEIGGPVGSMILIRATERPKQVDLQQISQKYQQNINKQRSNAYYMAGPQKVRELNRRKMLDIDVDGGGEFDPGDIFIGGGGSNMWIVILVVIIVIGAWWMYRRQYA